MIVSPPEDTVMGRRSGIRYFESKGGYFTNFEGSRYRLASGPDGAGRGARADREGRHAAGGGRRKRGQHERFPDKGRESIASGLATAPA